MYKSSIRAALRKASELYGVSMKQVAEAGGLNYGTLRQFACGNMEYSSENLEKLKLALEELTPKETY